MAKSMRIKADDMVKIIAGKDAGKVGRVTRTEPQRRFVYVEGLNMVKRHQKPQPVQNTQRKSQATGGIIEKEGPIHASNVMVVDPKDDKPTRVGVRAGKGGKRERYSKRSGEAI